MQWRGHELPGAAKEKRNDAQNGKGRAGQGLEKQWMDKEYTALT